MARGRHESVHTSVPRDQFNLPLDIDTPVDHPLFLKQEIDKNASGDPVAIRLFYKTTETDATPVVYSKSIDPGTGTIVGIDPAAATPVDVFESDLLKEL